MKYFPAVFDLHTFPTLYAEFSQLLADITRQAEPNPGVSYIVSEVLDVLPNVLDAPTFGRYAGSSIDVVGIKTRHTQRMNTFWVEVIFASYFMVNSLPFLGFSYFSWLHSQEEAARQ